MYSDDDLKRFSELEVETEPKTERRKISPGKKWLIVLTIIAIILIVIIIILVVLYACAMMELNSRQDFGIASGPWLKLPTSAAPTHYDINITVDMDPDYVFDGYVDIYFTQYTSDSYYIVINSYMLSIDDISIEAVDSYSQPNPAYINHQLYEQQQFLVILFDSALKRNGQYKLRVYFTGELGESAAGFYKTPFTDTEGNTQQAAVTKFETVFARRAFPCFDEPQYKSTFNITLNHDPQYTALSNTPVYNTQQLSTGYLSETYQQSPIMSTYLVAYFIGDYVNNTLTNNNVTYSIWLPEENFNCSDYFIDIHPKVVEYFEEYLDFDNPLTKIDSVMTNFHTSSAMENWGMVTYVPSASLYCNTSETWWIWSRTTRIVAHELAHFWFGNLLTCEWWDDIWLNEAFASAMAMFACEQIADNYDWNALSLLSSMKSLDLDAQAAVFPLRGAGLFNPDESYSIFTSTIYSKGSLVLFMMKDFVGEDIFQQALQLYVKTNAYSSVDSDDLWDAFQQVIDEDENDDSDLPTDTDIATIMDTWTKQTGIPVVTITRDYLTESDGTTANATQTRFMFDGSDQPDTYYPSEYEFEYYIPLTYTTSNDLNFDQPELEWMERSYKELTLNGITDSDYILGNIGRNGAYRMNYDDTNWNNIITALVDDFEDFPTIDKAGLIIDAFASVKANLAPADRPLKLIRDYLKLETEYAPWSAAMVELCYYSNMLADEANIHSDFKLFISDILTNVYTSYEWINSTSFKIMSTQKIIVHLSCFYGVEQCVSDAETRFISWMSDPDGNEIASEYKSLTYCTAIATGSEDYWDFAWDQFNDDVDRSSLLYGLTCTDDDERLSKLYSAVDSGEITAGDVSYVGGTDLCSNRGSRDIYWQILTTDWDSITENDEPVNKVGRLELFRLLFNTVDHLQQLEDFIEMKQDSFGHIDIILLALVEQVKSNNQWMYNNKDALKNYLRLQV